MGASPRYLGNMAVPQKPPTAPQSPYLTQLNNNSSLDQLNISRTVVLKNIDKSVTLNQLLSEIDYGPIEYCKMFERPPPKHITDVETVKYCYVSFINSKVALCFHLKYSKNNYNLSNLKERLNNSIHLKINLNDSYPSQNTYGGRGSSKQDYIKLKTLNYILEFNATRCLLIKFEFDPLVDEKFLEDHKSSVKETCSKYGEVEDYKVSTSQEKHEIKMIVHFTSIDSAIKIYEYYLKRILSENMDDENENESIQVKAVHFHKDRCDRTDLDKRSLNIPASDPSSPPREKTCETASEPVVSQSDVNSVSELPEQVNGDLTFDDTQEPESPSKSPEFKSEPALLTPQSTSASEGYLYNRTPVRAHGTTNPYPYNPDPFNVGNRTIYLGNLHPNSTVEEIANNVRAGGLVETINYRPEKRVCFITFVDPAIALKFYLNHQVLHQLIIHGYDITVGWAKNHSGPLNREVSLAVTAGASRNVYIGFKLNRESNDVVKNELPNQEPLPSEEQLRADFSKFGELEQINFYHNRDCGFLNFLNILDAIHVVEYFETEATDKIKEIVQDDGQFYERYSKFKIRFAKDRCGNPPKFSYKKRSRRRERIDFTYADDLPRIGESSTRSRTEKPCENDVDKDKSEQKIPKEAAMVFGISSKDSESDKETIDNDTPALENLTLNDENSSEKKEIKSENLDGADEKSNGEEDEDDEEDDEDDVSIIIGSDDTTSTTANNSNKGEMKKPFNSRSRASPSYKNRFRNLSSSSLNHHGQYSRHHDVPFGNYSPASYPYHPPHPPHPHLPAPPSQLPQHPYYSQGPRVNYGYYPSSAAPMTTPYSQYQQYPVSRGHYTSSGSQVMAQYLAKAQHDNLLYAAHVLSHDYDFEDEYSYNR